MKKQLLYWVPHTLLLLTMLGSAIYYFVDAPMAAKAFNDLGYPTYAMYFNAIAKILGGAAILLPVPRFLKEWAYAGYLFILLLAFQAVWVAMPGDQWPMLMFIAIWLWAYLQFRARAK